MGWGAEAGSSHLLLYTPPPVCTSAHSVLFVGGAAPPPPPALPIAACSAPMHHPSSHPPHQPYGSRYAPTKAHPRRPPMPRHGVAALAGGAAGISPYSFLSVLPLLPVLPPPSPTRATTSTGSTPTITHMRYHFYWFYPHRHPHAHLAGPLQAEQELAGRQGCRAAAALLPAPSLAAARLLRPHPCCPRLKVDQAPAVQELPHPAAEGGSAR